MPFEHLKGAMEGKEEEKEHILANFHFEYFYNSSFFSFKNVFVFKT